MKKICSVVGARPQFIKLAVVSRALRKYFQEVIIHTGQHFDHNMSDIFFEEMGIPKPDYNLGISGGTHAEMTGKMLMDIEKVLVKEKPDLLLLFGDTNSTLAAALAAVKLQIPIAHVEAGNRLGSLKNPEEANRILTDHISSVLFACVPSAVDFLKKEGKSDCVHLVGDPMYDAFLYYSKKEEAATALCEMKDLQGNTVDLPNEFYYLTCHRQENTQDENTLLQILSAMNTLESPTIYPVHPRSQPMVHQLCKKYQFENLLLTKPVGYLASIALVSRAKKIVTDSGGVQREAFFAKKQCVTVFDYIVWPETMKGEVNCLAMPEKGEILAKLSKKVDFDDAYQPFGDGHSAEKICETLKRKLSE